MRSTLTHLAAVLVTAPMLVACSSDEAPTDTAPTAADASVAAWALSGAGRDRARAYLRGAAEPEVWKQLLVVQWRRISVLGCNDDLRCRLNLMEGNAESAVVEIVFEPDDDGLLRGVELEVVGGT